MPVLSLMKSTRCHVAPPSAVLNSPRSPPAENSGPCAATYTTSELRGSITMRPICSELASPMRLHVLPASADLYNPSPKCALRWLLFSPVPSQRTLASFGSISMQQRLCVVCSSKSGVKEAPRLTVFQRPPNAVAMYHVLGLDGSILMSAMRPVTSPGPMERACSPLSMSAVSAGAAATGSALVAPWRWARTSIGASTRMAVVQQRNGDAKRMSGR